MTAWTGEGLVSLPTQVALHLSRGRKEQYSCHALSTLETSIATDS